MRAQQSAADVTAGQKQVWKPAEELHGKLKKTRQKKRVNDTEIKRGSSCRLRAKNVVCISSF